ncbi:MAG: MarR family transcriptional regulator [Oscillospiraceae bacterium]|nr:MarR family transcriptional regulator [Oscillospiraceae bacterium]
MASTNSNAKDLEYGLARGISAIERRHRKFMTRALEEKCVTGVSYSYIITIKRHPGLNQDVLASIHGVDKSRAARIVRDLEDSGYLSRELAPDNRRQYMLSLTQSGERLYEFIADKNMEWEKLMSGDIKDSSIATTVDTINKIIKNLDNPHVRLEKI